MTDETDSLETDAPRRTARRAAESVPPAAGHAPEAPRSSPRSTVVVPIDGFFLDWLERRAEVFGQSPGDHASLILREYWAQHDQWRHAGARKA